MALAQSSSKNNKPTVGGINGGGEGVVPKFTTFHDFLGSTGQGYAGAVPPVRPPAEASPSATLDLGSERNTSSRLEGIPFYGPRGDTTVQESSNKFTRGTKRNHSDSFIMSPRDNRLQVDSQDSPLLTKLLRYSGGERPLLASFVPQPSAGIRTATAVNTGPMPQLAPRINQAVQLGYQTTSNRFKDKHVVRPSVVSQPAADEGSRTGVKGYGILSSANATGGAVLPGRQLAGVLVRVGKHTPEPDNYSSSTTPSSHHGTGTHSAGGQMTIFYRGQAHVFDSVHLSKADAIMALAGSSGGCWSTSYASDSAVRQASGENSDAVGVAVSREERRGPSQKGDV